LQAIETRGGWLMDLTAVSFIDTSGRRRWSVCMKRRSLRRAASPGAAFQPLPWKALHNVGLDQVLVLEA